jgi:hypothetical protein
MGDENVQADAQHRAISSSCALTPEQARRLDQVGFVVVPGPEVSGDPAALAMAYDRAVSSADPAGISVRSSTRVDAFVDRGREFDGIYLHPPLLAACCRIIGGPFQLSTMHARTLEPGAPIQGLHVDVRRGADGWPLVGFILMVDGFRADNGATRFVAGSHAWPVEPADPGWSDEQAASVAGHACGEAGSMIIFHGSAWHGHDANRSGLRRRSIQGAFIPRLARAASHHAARIGADTLRRLGARARYLLAIPPGAG